MNLTLFDLWAMDQPTPRPRKRRVKQGKVLRPVHPNAGIEAQYVKALRSLIDEMHKSVRYWLVASYRSNPPIMAMDEAPYKVFLRKFNELVRKWSKRIDDGAERLAKYFAQSASKRSTKALHKILKDAGFAVEFEMTPAMRSVLEATVEANVGLIKSIPQKYFEGVRNAVTQSVTTGWDMKTLTDHLEREYHVTRKRAVFIARDQNSKATAAFTRARQLEAGITEAIWLHGGAGKEPRRTHLAAGKAKTKYNIAEGWYDPEAEKVNGGGFIGRFIHPGELINCRCVSKSVVKGFT
jgi:uncharacterized protein with gpF-like domain